MERREKGQKPPCDWAAMQYSIVLEAIVLKRDANNAMRPAAFFWSASAGSRAHVCLLVVPIREKRLKFHLDPEARHQPTAGTVGECDDTAPGRTRPAPA